MSDYPECEKLDEVGESRILLCDFLGWLEGKGFEICERFPETDRYWPTYKSADTLVLQFFDIDEKKLEVERKDMLNRLQEVANG